MASTDVTTVIDASPRPVGAGAGGSAPQRARASSRRTSAVALGPEFDGVAPAATGPRVLAYGIDALGVVLVGALVLAATRSVVYATLAMAELAVGVLVWEARTGATFGNAALGLRTARVETPYAPGLGRVMLRALVVAAGHLGLGVGQWLVVGSTAFDQSGRGQGWHDKAGRAVVVDVRARRQVAPPASAGAGRRETTATAAVAVATLAPLPAASTSGALVAPAPDIPRVVAPLTPAGPVAPAVRADPVIPVAPEARVAPAGRAAPVRPSPTAFVITLDTGEAMTVTGPGLVGRSPRVAPGERCDHVIEIEDPERTLSRTHARFGIDAGVFWVSDAGSGNGTVVISSGGSAVAVAPDRRVPVPSGGTVRIGDRSFTVNATDARRR